MEPKTTIKLFDEYLAKAGEKVDAIVIDGAALVLLDVVKRPTKDFDILQPVLTKSQELHVVGFASENPELNIGPDWMNNGPRSLIHDLDEGWEGRLQPAFKGKAITLRTLHRLDLLKTKLFALCDRGSDWEDCMALRPTESELVEAEEWVADRDANPDWPAYVTKILIELRERLEGVV